MCSVVIHPEHPVLHLKVKGGYRLGLPFKGVAIDVGGRCSLLQARVLLCWAHSGCEQPLVPACNKPVLLNHHTMMMMMMTAHSKYSLAMETRFFSAATDVLL